MGWQKKLGAHTDNSDRCTAAEWFAFEALEGEETVFAARHYESGCLLSIGKDASVGFAGENACPDVDGAVAARFVSALKKLLENPAALMLSLR